MYIYVDESDGDGGLGLLDGIGEEGGMVAATQGTSGASAGPEPGVQTLAMDGVAAQS